MKNLAERLIYARKQRGLTQSSLAKLAKVSTSTIGNIEAGVRFQPQSLTQIAHALHYSALWLLEGVEPKEETGNTEPATLSARRVPVISWVQAGNWTTVMLEARDNHEWVETTVPLHTHTYALRVKGPSMTAAAGEPTFPHGTVIIVEPDAIGPAEEMTGRFVVVRRFGEEEAVFKQLVREGDRYFLAPLNLQWPTLELGRDDIFCGVVREKITRFF